MEKQPGPTSTSQMPATLSRRAPTGSPAGGGSGRIFEGFRRNGKMKMRPEERKSTIIGNHESVLKIRIIATI